MNRNRGAQRLSVCILILTSTVLACQSVAGFNPFATATPTVTQTPTITPTPTFTVTPSPTPTATITLTPTLPPTGMSIEEQTGEGLLVIDYDNKYQFQLPPEWKVVFSSQKDLQAAVDFASDINPDFAKVAQSFKDVDPDIFRLAAINTNQKYTTIKFPTVLTVNAFADPLWSGMPMAFVTAMIEDTILKGATSTTWDASDNANKVEVGTVRGVRAITATNGARATVAELVIAFQANKKLIVIEIATPKEFKDAVLTPFDGIIDSIKVDL